MKKALHTRGALVGACVVIAATLFSLIGCQPQQRAEDEAVLSPVGHNAVTMGEFETFDPEVEAAETGGEAIRGSEEDELQQERIAGGATGNVVSQNLAPLEGITDPSPGEYNLVFGMNFQAPPIDMADQQPLSHLKARLSVDECASCHITQ